MATKDYIPRKYSDLSNWLVKFIDYLEVHAELFGIDPILVIKLRGNINVYIVAFNKANSAEATRSDLLYRQEQAAVVSTIVREFVNKFLRYNDSVTNEDRLSLGLTIPDHTPSPIPPPATWPEAIIKILGERRIAIGFRDYGSNQRGKPKDVTGCEIRRLISDTRPESIEDMLASVFSTRSPYIFTFDESERGKTVYFCLRWENARGQKGPWSTIYSVIIP
jgi:hypothetical protein